MKARYSQTMAPLLSQIADAPWENPQFYAQWVAQTHHFVSRSTRLITLAGSLFRENKLHNRFIEYTREERSHDILAATDLKHLGFDLKDFPEYAVTAAFSQAQAYWILFHGSVSFFGYIICLEGLAVDFGKQAYARVLKAHGSKATGFLRIHSQEDPDHLESAFATLSEVSKHDLALVEKNLIQSAACYSAILTECSLATRSRLKIAG